MKKLRFFFFISLLFIFSAGCSDFVTDSSDFTPNDELMLMSKKVPVPFSATFSVWLTEEPVPIDGRFEQAEYGSSVAPHPTHMGVTEFYSEEVIYLSEGTGYLPWEEVDPWNAVAHVTLTAANGDQMNVEVNYILDPTGFPLFYCEGTGTVDGGTGRFENASGELSFSADFNVAELKGNHYYSGEIIY
ncbi:MAG: hypothetical protein JXR65_03350 [Bacteroidales bacterium]|nr:hypothetical protein [Bacteroidales bacterium]